MRSRTTSSSSPARVSPLPRSVSSSVIPTVLPRSRALPETRSSVSSRPTVSFFALVVHRWAGWREPRDTGDALARAGRRVFRRGRCCRTSETTPPQNSQAYDRSPVQDSPPRSPRTSTTSSRRQSLSASTSSATATTRVRPPVPFSSLQADPSPQTPSSASFSSSPVSTVWRATTRPAPRYVASSVGREQELTTCSLAASSYLQVRGRHRLHPYRLSAPLDEERTGTEGRVVMLLCCMQHGVHSLFVPFVALWCRAWVSRANTALLRQPAGKWGREEASTIRQSASRDPTSLRRRRGLDFGRDCGAFDVEDLLSCQRVCEPEWC